MPRAKSFEEEVAYYEQKRAANIAVMRKAFEESAAVIVSWKKGRDELWILSRDTHPAAAGEEPGWRITRLGKDGPWGHDTRASKGELYKLAAEVSPDRVQPATEAEVIEWTSTPEYERGAEWAGFIQAVNTLSWVASKAGASDMARPIERGAHEMAAAGDVPGATKMLTDATRAIGQRSPRSNPAPEFVPNPPWVAKVIADNYHRLETEIGPQWLPKFGDLRASRNRISASIKELGCGAYGCVLPTINHDIVLKVTSDASEMDFVVKVLPDLPTLITTKYVAWMWLKNVHDGRRVGLLWREAADFVGRIVDALPESRALDALVAIRAQHDAASQALVAAMKGHMRDLPGLLAVWAGLTERMTRIPELRFMAMGMLAAWEQQGVFFADVHEGNVGRVTRDGQQLWVITDPGNVVVIGSREE